MQTIWQYCAMYSKLRTGAYEFESIDLEFER